MSCSCFSTNQSQNNNNTISKYKPAKKRPEAIQKAKEELEFRCGRKLVSTMNELYDQIERFQQFATKEYIGDEKVDDIKLMDVNEWRDMIGILGNYQVRFQYISIILTIQQQIQISERMFSAIDRDKNGVISIEEYLIYNDIQSNGTQEEKNKITFEMINLNQDNVVTYNEFKEFWMQFIELYSEANQQKLQYQEDVIEYAFKCISGQENREKGFTLDDFQKSKLNNPELFEWLESPGQYMKEFAQQAQSKQQKIEFQVLENFYQEVKGYLENLQDQVEKLLFGKEDDKRESYGILQKNVSLIKQQKPQDIIKRNSTFMFKNNQNIVEKIKQSLYGKFENNFAGLKLSIKQIKERAENTIFNQQEIQSDLIQDEEDGHQQPFQSPIQKFEKYKIEDKKLQTPENRQGTEYLQKKVTTNIFDYQEDLDELPKFKDDLDKEQKNLTVQQLIKECKIQIGQSFNEIKQAMDAKYNEQIQKKRMLSQSMKEDKKSISGGQQIRFGHEKFDLILNIMIGIKRSISNLVEIPFMELSDKQFKVKNQIQNQWISNSKKLKNVKSFRFSDYAPMVFQRLRKISGIDEEEYANTLGPDSILNCFWTNNYQALYELCSSGKSGSLFYYTENQKYMLKTISKDEFKKLRQILPEYYNHLQFNPESLITRFYGLHKVSFKGSSQNKKYLVIMNNVFRYFKIGNRFDLKGSTVGRKTLKNGQDLSSGIGEKIALKDLDFLEFSGKIQFIKTPWNKSNLLDILEKDSQFFHKTEIIDYSLLLGQIKGPHTSEQLVDLIANGSENEQGIYFTENNESYIVGIIDILTEFNSKKNMEYIYKRISQGMEMSCIPPKYYARRFSKFMKEIISIKEQ